MNIVALYGWELESKRVCLREGESVVQLRESAFTSYLPSVLDLTIVNCCIIQFLTSISVDMRIYLPEKVIFTEAARLR